MHIVTYWLHLVYIIVLQCYVIVTVDYEGKSHIKYLYLGTCMVTLVYRMCRLHLILFYNPVNVTR